MKRRKIYGKFPQSKASFITMIIRTKKNFCNLITWWSIWKEGLMSRRCYGYFSRKGNYYFMTVENTKDHFSHFNDSLWHKNKIVKSNFVNILKGGFWFIKFRFWWPIAHINQRATPVLRLKTYFSSIKIS